MTVADAIKKAVQENDARLAGRIADALRARGMNYDGVYQFVRAHTGVSLADWEALMQEADDAESHS